MGWDALHRWGGEARRIRRLTGGSANDVWAVNVRGQLAVARLGTRDDSDLEWEADLLQHLDRAGLSVPVPIPTDDGRPFAEGLTVMKYVPGEPPRTEDDWRRVAATLREVHRLTEGWPQRPGWRSTLELVQVDSCTKIDLRRMPPEAVARCRAAWARLAGREMRVIHGNPANPGNVRINGGEVALIDWDEAHVDVAELDLPLPYNAAGLEGLYRDHIEQATAAWEATVSWGDDYSRRRLAEVRAV